MYLNAGFGLLVLLGGIDFICSRLGVGWWSSRRKINVGNESTTDFAFMAVIMWCMFPGAVFSGILVEEMDQMGYTFGQGFVTGAVLHVLVPLMGLWILRAHFFLYPEEKKRVQPVLATCPCGH